MKHVGLAMVRTDGLGADGKIPKDSRSPWIDGICGIGESEGYLAFFGQWQLAMTGRPGSLQAELTSTSRTFIGHGLPSSHEVGLSLHHTYGLPYIPGSALKGILAHYVHTRLGEKDPAWKGPGLDDRGAVVVDPGANFKAVFGNSPSDTDKDGAEGFVEFHDALLVPGQTNVLTQDILTPHQSKYYRDSGASLPCDYDEPIPVSFVTASPKIKYRLNLSGHDSWVALAMKLLERALRECGVGGKTSSGYGRFSLQIIESPEVMARRIAEEKSKVDLKVAEDKFRQATMNAQGAHHAQSITEALRKCIELKVSAEFCAELIVARKSDKFVRTAVEKVLADQPWPELAALLATGTGPIKTGGVEPPKVDVASSTIVAVKVWLKGRDLLWRKDDQTVGSKTAMNLKYFDKNGESIRSTVAVARLGSVEPSSPNAEIEFNGTRVGKVILP